MKNHYILNPKKISKYFGIFWLSFILLQGLVMVPRVRNGLANMHAELFGSVAENRLTNVVFLEKKGTDGGMMIFTFYNNKKVLESKKRGEKKVDVKVYKYENDPEYLINTVLVFLIALCLATPLALSKRLILILVSLLFFYFYTFIRMTFKLKYQINNLHIGLYEDSPNDFITYNRIDSWLSTFGLILIIVIIIWAMQVFSKNNMNEMKRTLST